MQAKLLRVLEERQVERIGGDRSITVDVRVVVATHRNLDELVKKGTFRQDLYHRIYVYPLTLPPLRERVDDIPALVEHFAAQVAAQNGWKPTPFERDAIAELQRYSWPGNVRELRNVVERLMLLAEARWIAKRCGWRCQEIQRRYRRGCGVLRIAGAARGCLRARADPDGAQTSSADDGHGESSGLGAEPPL